MFMKYASYQGTFPASVRLSWTLLGAVIIHQAFLAVQGGHVTVLTQGVGGTCVTELMVPVVCDILTVLDARGSCCLAPGKYCKVNNTAMISHSAWIVVSLSL